MRPRDGHGERRLRGCSSAGHPWACCCGRGRGGRRSAGLPLRTRRPDGRGRRRLRESGRPRVVSLWTRSEEEGGARPSLRRGHGTTAEVVASADAPARVGRGGCRIKRMRRLDGCVATAASDAAERAFKLLQGSFCSAVASPRSPLGISNSNACFTLLVVCSSLFSSADTAGATVDSDTSSCTPLVQLISDLSVPSHSGQARNMFPTFGLPVKGVALRSLPRHFLTCS